MNPRRSRLRTLLTVAGWTTIGVCAVPLGFLGVGAVGSPLYAIDRVICAYLNRPPHERLPFALSVVAVIALLLIGSFALFRDVRNNGPLAALWCGALVGVLCYGVLALSLSR